MDFSETKTWDERYTKNSSEYEWYVDWPLLKAIVREHVSHKSIILHVGCGTSALGEALLNDGYKEIINIDSSEVVVKTRNNAKHCTYKCVDVRQMECFMTAEFDAVIDKGTLDCLMCSNRATSHTGQAVCEIYRVLKPGGTFLCISHASPSKRTGILQRSNFKWTVTYLEIPRVLPFDNGIGTVDPPVYCYVCKKAQT